MIAEAPIREVKSDTWSEWLQDRRHGRDSQFKPQILAIVERIRDRVLDAAQITPGMQMLDVGAGEGLIGFGALDRVGPFLRVILADISEPLLNAAKDQAAKRGYLEQCEFLLTPAESLEGVADISCDVLTTRSSLAYVADKASALRQFHRVLKPGGRISMAEPIFQDDAVHLAALTQFLESQPVDDAKTAHMRLLQRTKAAQLPSTRDEILKNSLTNFSERDLLNLCQQAGFEGIHLELHIDVRKREPSSWDAFIDTAQRPNVPTLREIFAGQFSEQETRMFETNLRPLVEAGGIVERDTMAYLVATKPI